MKKALKVMAMVLFVAGMTTLTSCTKSNAKLILGKWQVENVTLSSGGMTIQLTMQQLAEMLDLNIDMPDIIVEFRNDGYLYGGDDRIAYSVNEDKLTFYDEDGAHPVDILELTSSKLSIGADFKDEETGLSYDVVVNLKKV